MRSETGGKYGVRAILKQVGIRNTLVVPRGRLKNFFERGILKSLFVFGWAPVILTGLM
jgi:hypothetical protein